MNSADVKDGSIAQHFKKHEKIDFYLFLLLQKD